MSGTGPSGETTFQAAFALTIGAEGGFTDNPADPGNWTGGAVNKGTLKGTKYGISAAAYPALDIANLSLVQAQAIYEQDYWAKAGCDLCPPPLAVLVFDAAVNNGVGNAVKWLQGALGVSADGIIGPQTRAALAGLRDAGAAAVALHAARIRFMAGLSTWPSFAGGWSQRLAQMPFAAGRIAGPAAATGG